MKHLDVRSMEIRAPYDRVFEHLADPTRLPRRTHACTAVAGRFLRRPALSVLVALLVAGCGAVAQSAAPLGAKPPLHRAPGGGYVSGDTSYHGSGGQ